MSIIQTLATDATAVESFLETEGQKVVAWASTVALPAVEKVFTNLVNDAKEGVSELVTGAESALPAELTSLEADFKTAIANAIQLLLKGSPEAVLLTQLSATGLDQFVASAEALIKPLFVQVLADLAPTPAATPPQS